ncbi:MAG: hypothetical protein AAFO95_01905 [Cyanobacteria bacterium J06600_6]
MNNLPSSPINLPLKVNQIVSLDYLDHHLYGEVIQLIPDRQLCWFRPLCLSLVNLEQQDFDLNSCLTEERSSSQKTSTQQNLVAHSQDYWKTNLIDLQSSSDLLWPDVLFRPALDSEIIDFLPQLSDISHISKNNKINQKCLNKFVYLVWQAHQDKF